MYNINDGSSAQLVQNLYWSQKSAL